MRRRDSSEFKSLVDLLDENTPAKKLSRDQKLKAHLRNLLKIRTYQSGPKGPGTGTGYLLTGDGFFVTNHHVLPGEEATVYINKISFPFQIQRTLIRSRPHDLVLAQISLSSDDLPSVVLANRRARKGEKVRTYSFSKDKALRSHGEIVSYNYDSKLVSEGLDFLFGADREKNSNPLLDLFGLDGDLQSKVNKNIQHSTCTIKPGWSGGPVVNDHTGEIVGITRAIGAFINFYYSSRQYHAFSSVTIVRTMIDRYLDGEVK